MSFAPTAMQLALSDTSSLVGCRPLRAQTDFWVAEVLPDQNVLKSTGMAA